MSRAPTPGPARTHFGRCRERLELAIAADCVAEASWPGAVRAAVRSALDFAAADPDAGRTLTAAAGRHHDDEDEFAALVDHLAGRLARGAPPRNERLPDAPAIVVRIARQVNLELEAGRAASLRAKAPDLTFLALMPYLGFTDARRWCQPTATA